MAQRSRLAISGWGLPGSLVLLALAECYVLPASRGKPVVSMFVIEVEELMVYFVSRAACSVPCILGTQPFVIGACRVCADDGPSR
eukprot:5098557-Lingulodinium_polyedra.AAC.1